jgi:hypothetical protein
VSTRDPSLGAAVAVGAAAAAVMIGFQTAAKATRDALFLSTFPVTALPRMIIVAAVCSVALAAASTRLLTRLGPARVIPVAFGASAVLLIGEWALAAGSRRLVAVLFYLHYAALGAVLISGFWSIINERFDPRTAKRVLGSIAAGGTAGGVVGGVLAAQAADLMPVPTMLPLLAALHLACGWLALVLGRSGRVGGAVAHDGRSGFAILAETPYLRGLLVLVLLTTVAEGLLDYVFKARASTEFAREEDLLRLFAWFHTGVAAAAFAVQAGVARLALQHLGLARTVAALPTVVVVGGAAALALPGLVSAMVARGVEAVTRNGLYRAGYELLYAPLPPHEKRATKVLVDVGAVRLGDVLAGLTVQAGLVVLIAPQTMLLIVAILLALLAGALTYGLQLGYATTLERGLLARAGRMDDAEAQDLATRTALLHTAGAVGVTLDALEPSHETGTAPSVRSAPSTTSPAPLPPGLARLADLESRDAGRVRRALNTGPLTRALVPHVVPLLAWDAVARDAIAALRDAAPASVGALADHLLDPDEDFAVRRRLPLVLAAHPSARTVAALLAGLGDQRFEVRYRCGRALSRLMQADPSLTIDADLVRAAVLREVAVDRGVWESQRLLDQVDDEGWSPVADELIRDRASRSVEHVFTMLALVLPRQPLTVAFRGLHTDDAQLRGTALEYLEATLPDDIRRALWPFLEDHRPAGTNARPTEAVLRELLESHQSIVLNLEHLKRR